MSDHLVRLADVRRREVVWLQHGTIPRGMLSLLAGHPGLGKSMWALALASKLSLAGQDVVICSAEDSLEHSIKPRLQACEADTSRIHALIPRDTNGDPRGLTFPSDAPILLDAVRDVGAVLAIIDPITAHLDTAVDSHKDASLRSALAPLARIAEETLASLLGVMHLNKNGASSDPMMRLGGSIGGPGQARSALLLDRDPDDPEKDRGRRRILAHFKSNVGPLAESRLLDVQPVHLEATGLEPAVETARIVDLGESKHSAAEILSRAGDDRSAIEEAVGFLQAELDDGSSIEAKAIRRRARELGISDRTLDRAKKALGVESARAGGLGAAGAWEWRLSPLSPPASRARAGEQSRAFLDDDEAHLGRNGAGFTKDAAKACDEATFAEDGDL